MTPSFRLQLRPLIMGVLLLGAITVPAFAGPLTAEVTYTVTSNKSSMSTADWTDGTLEMPKFNPAAFTAWGVTLAYFDLTLTSSLASTVTIRNDGTVPAKGSVFVTTEIDVLNTDAGIEEVPFLTVQSYPLSRFQKSRLFRVSLLVL
jgi:hypothetical protein